MYLTAISLVIASGLIHSVWNLFTKKSVNKIVFLWHCQWISVLLFLPFAVKAAMAAGSAVPLRGWLLVLASMIIHGVYVYLLAKAYTFGDLSHVYPIMRGTAPLFIPILGVTLLGETLTLLGWVGVLAIVAGIWSIHRGAGQRREPFSRATALALAVGISITCYTLVDKLALQYVSPVLLNEFGNIGNMLALTWAAVRSGEIRQEWRLNRSTIVLGGVLAPGGYILMLYALTVLPASQLVPMREIGTVFAAVLGIFVLKEKQGRSRLIAAAWITAGVIVLGVYGGGGRGA
jgi:drug/metabolite transporter (DMT)-like permease